MRKTRGKKTNPLGGGKKQVCVPMTPEEIALIDSARGETSRAAYCSHILVNAALRGVTVSKSYEIKNLDTLALNDESEHYGAAEPPKKRKLG